MIRALLMAMTLLAAPQLAVAAKKKAPPPAKKKEPAKEPAKDLNVPELFNSGKPQDGRPAETKSQEAKPATETKTTSQKPSSPPGPGSHVNAIDVALGVRVFGRTLSLYDDLFGAFFPHRQPFAAAPALKAAYFPGAHVSTGVPAWFGVHLLFDIAPGLRVRAPDASLRNVTAFQVGGGLSARYPHPRFELRVDFGFVAQQFAFGDPPAGTTTTVTARALSITYLSLRPALVLRVKVIDRLAIVAEGAYRIVVGTGDVKTMFPRSNAGGFDLAIGASVPLALGFEARATFDYAHYFFDMRPQPGDRFVLGGALDQYVGATLAVAFRR